MLVDSARILVRAGRGGNGCVSFRREKFVPHGGPNGGDGGRGGDVILRVSQNHNTLLHVHHRRTVRAESGSHGQGSNKTGGGGESAIVEVPPGTVIRDNLSGDILGDLTVHGEDLIVARGGRGGRGNARFSTSTDRAPRTSEDGHPGEERELHLELKLMADVGLVGLPNAGKSTLLSAISAARPKVADYPFTTLEPHLGVVRSPGDDYRTLVMADIPGLIEGAHEGAGLGIQFLRHVERCRVLIHLVDLSAGEDDLETRVRTIRDELAAFDEGLAQRPWLLVGTKIDAVFERGEAERALTRVGDCHGVATHTISAVTREGVAPLIYRLFELNATACEEEQ